MSDVDILYVCHSCGWTFSLQRNQVCPMCKTPADINEKLIFETVQEYARRKGLFVSKKEAKLITNEFKKKYGRLPSFKEIWSIADRVVLQKADGEKVSIEDKVAKKMKEMEQTAAVKQARKVELEAKRKGVEVKTVAGLKITSDDERLGISGGGKCPKCGRMNPSESKFCLECGGKLD